MPQLRQDPISKTWVVVAEERGRRPSDFKNERLPDNSAQTCPFCMGREDQTPKEVFALREQGEADTAGWDVRVIPNKFPALAPKGALNPESRGPYTSMNGVGAHEVIVDSPDHVLTLADLPQAQVQKVVHTYVSRLSAVYENEHCVYAQLFKNDGKDAGASLAHPHTQLMGLPLLPDQIRTELNHSIAYFEEKGQSLFEGVGNDLLNHQELLVELNEDFLLFTPYASRFAYEMHILPRFESHDFVQLDKNKQVSFSIILASALKRLKLLLNDPPFNFYLHTSPNSKAVELDAKISKAFRWHIEIIPRLSVTAGFEWGSGVYINSTPPEMAAQLLRECI